MDPGHKFGPKRGMDRAVPGKPALPLEGRGTDGHPEMALAPLAVARMAAMGLAFVHHFEGGWGEGFRQPLPDLVAHCHLFARSPLLMRGRRIRLLPPSRTVPGAGAFRPDRERPAPMT